MELVKTMDNQTYHPVFNHMQRHNVSFYKGKDFKTFMCQEEGLKN